MIFETLKLWAKAVILGGTNISYYTLPVLWVLYLIPHLFAHFSCTTSTGKNVDSSDPKAVHRDHLVTSRIRSQISRAETVAADTTRCAPFFAAAVLAGNQVGLSNSLLNALSLAYVLTRAAYIDVYILGESMTAAVFQELLSFAGHCIICTIFVFTGASCLS